MTKNGIATSNFSATTSGYLISEVDCSMVLLVLHQYCALIPSVMFVNNHVNAVKTVSIVVVKMLELLQRLVYCKKCK